MSPQPDSSAAPVRVTAAILSVVGADAGEAVELLAAQSHPVEEVVLVGGDGAIRDLANVRGLKWFPRVRDLTDHLKASHVWLLHADTRARPDALAALTHEIERLEASVAGSKVLEAENPQVLESIGGATDVFGNPYTGLQPGEVDDEQYDVVRDVAFVPGASVLVRTDLLRGLGGPDPLLAPGAAQVDFSQRARVAGGRVVVVPSSEVFHAGECRHGIPGWREEAGRVRSAVKVYSWPTLLWVLPAALILGLAAALARTLMGRPAALVDFARVWAWNSKNLTSTLSSRREARRSKLAGDEELFRYQLRGSVLIRDLGDEVTAWVDRRSQDQAVQVVGAWVDRRRGFWQRSAFWASSSLVALALLFTWRVMLHGLPVTGFALPLPDSALDALRAATGGWNPAGLGSPEPMHPSAGAVALAGLVLGSRGALTATFLTVGSAVGALIGADRLFRLLGLGVGARFAGAAALLVSPPILGLLADGYWPGLLAVAAVPWVLRWALLPWPVGLVPRLGRLSFVALGTGAVGVFAPLGGLVPALVLVGMAAASRRSWAWARALIGVAAAAPLLFPWLAYVSLGDLANVGAPLDAAVPPWMGVLVMVVAVIVLVVAEGSGPVGVGAVMFFAGWALQRWSAHDLGREPSIAGALLAGVGFSFVAAYTVSLAIRSARWRRFLVGAAAVAVAVPVAAGFPSIVEGRAGLLDEDLRTTVAFASARADSHGPDRILFIGDIFPGEARQVEGVSYRVASATIPYVEAWMPEARVGDRELERLLIALKSSDDLRPGQALSTFGIGWVVVEGSNDFVGAFSGRLDMQQLLSDPIVFENLVSSPRATSSAGAWSHAGFGYEGPAADQVLVLENASDAWGVRTGEHVWANWVAGTTGTVAAAVDPLFRAFAWIGASTFVGLVTLAILGRRRTS